VKAIADIRPSSVFRAFHGDWSSPSALEVRQGLMSVYGYKSEDEAKRNIAVYEDYRELLKDPDIEGVIIALPLHLHAQAAIDAMKAGKHVLTEKLMAHNIAQCKVMSRFSQDQNLLLATGHQRHYSVLYDNAVNLIRWGLLGQLHHIRAQWHRGNLPGADSWAPPLPGGFDVGGKKIDPIKSRVNSLRAALAKEKNAEAYANLEMQLAQWEALDQDKDIRPEEFGYETVTLSDGRVRSDGGADPLAPLGPHRRRLDG
jgi:predicted dehydrogenase